MRNRLKRFFAAALAAVTAAMLLTVQAGAIVYKQEAYDYGLIQTDRRLWQLRILVDDGMTYLGYGIDVSEIASMSFNVSTCDENGNVITDNENNYGGYLFTSCNGGDLTREETRARNWVSYFWNDIGGTYVTEGEEITDTISASSVDNGDGSWTINAAINADTGFSPLGTTCQFGIACSYMNVYIRVNTASLLDASGNVLLSFDGTGKPIIGTLYESADAAASAAETTGAETTAEETTTEEATTEETTTEETTAEEAVAEETTSEETTAEAAAEETTTTAAETTAKAADTTIAEATDAAATTTTQAAVAANSAASQANFSDRNTSLYIIAAIVILIIVGVVAFVIFNKFVRK